MDGKQVWKCSIYSRCSQTLQRLNLGFADVERSPRGLGPSGGGGGGGAGGVSGRSRWEADFAVLAVFPNNFRKSFNSCANISFPDFILLCTSSPNLNASLSNLLALALNLFRS